MWVSLFIDGLSAVGLAVTLVGALVAVRAVTLTDEQAVEIGLGRASSSSSDMRENLELPAVRNLLAASHGAMKGFRFVALGTAMQLVSPLGELISGFCNLYSHQ